MRVLQSEIAVDDVYGVRYHFGVLDREYYFIGDGIVFSKSEMMAILRALVVQEKSVQRLAAKEGQPDSVAQEYRKVGAEIADLIKKVNLELHKVEVKK